MRNQHFTGRLLLCARPDVERKKGREDSIKERERKSSGRTEDRKRGYEETRM